MALRGRWDRAAGTEARAVAHRRAIGLAAARAVFELGRAVTVSDVVRRAGVGRNTFYVSFDDLAGALAWAEGDALERINRALEPSPETRTPIERLRWLAFEWLTLARDEPHLVTLVIRGDGTPRGAHGRLRDMLENAVRGVAVAARTAGVIGRPTNVVRLRVVAAAFVAFAERIIEESGRNQAGRLADELVECCLRVLR